MHAAHSSLVHASQPEPTNRFQACCEIEGTRNKSQARGERAYSTCVQLSCGDLSVGLERPPSAVPRPPMEPAAHSAAAMLSPHGEATHVPSATAEAQSTRPTRPPMGLVLCTCASAALRATQMLAANRPDLNRTRRRVRMPTALVWHSGPPAPCFDSSLSGDSDVDPAVPTGTGPRARGPPGAPACMPTAGLRVMAQPR